MELGFDIWIWIPLFWAMAPVRALAKGDVGRYTVGFGYGWGQERVWGDWVILN